MAGPAPKGRTPGEASLFGALDCLTIVDASDFLAEAEGMAAMTAHRLVTTVNAMTTVDVLLAKIVSRELAIPRSSSKRHPGHFPQPSTSSARLMKATLATITPQIEFRSSPKSKFCRVKAGPAPLRRSGHIPALP
jgi:hypothetical protein